MTTNSKNLAMMLVGFAAIISVGVFSATNTAEASQEDVPGMMGHITLVLHDSEGNITDYVQTDNAVTVTGINCISENSFGVNSACAATFFTFIGLGTGTLDSPQAENVETPLAGAGGCIRSDADDLSTNDVATSTGTATETVTLTVVFGGAGSTGAGLAHVDCEATISEAGLFNAATGSQMFAFQSFTGIAVGNLDTLTVTWTITII